MQPIATPERPLLKTKKQAAEYLGGISPRSIERLVKAGKLRAIKLGGRVMFATRDLDSLAT